MKGDAVLEWIFCNHTLQQTDQSAMLDLIDGQAIYEVIKVQEGVPLFFQDHWQRMLQSAAMLGVKMLKSADEVLTEIDQLVHKCGQGHVNAKLVFTSPARQSLFLTYLVMAERPPDDAYQRGIHAIFYQGERHEPHLKTVSSSYRERASQLRVKTGAFEALLVDALGHVTEGTRSNLFFIKEGALCTPPAGKVLMGVTRKHVMQICTQLKADVREAPLHRSEIPQLQGAFITGTTVDVMPIGSIEQHQLPSARNALIQTIVERYRQMEASQVDQAKTDLR